MTHIHISPAPAREGTAAVETWRRRIAHEQAADDHGARAAEQRVCAILAEMGGDRRRAARNHGQAAHHSAAERGHRQQADADEPKPI